MTIEEIIKRIELPEDAKAHALTHRLPDEEFLSWKSLFENELETFLSKWKESPEHFEWILWFYLKLACEVHERYQAKKISEQIFNDTFLDITIWCEECYRKYQVYGLEEAAWIAKSIRMELFRIGRLQFEPIILNQEEAGRYNLPAGEKVLNVHIPTGKKLDYSECRKSFEQAKFFFDDKNVVFICDSWLLSPELCEILPETSNIIRFQKMYQITDVHYDFPQAEERVFGEIRMNKEEYPEKNYLQRGLKQYLLSGKKVGIGRGILRK